MEKLGAEYSHKSQEVLRTRTVLTIGGGAVGARVCADARRQDHGECERRAAWGLSTARRDDSLPAPGVEPSAGLDATPAPRRSPPSVDPFAHPAQPSTVELKF